MNSACFMISYFVIAIAFGLSLIILILLHAKIEKLKDYNNEIEDRLNELEQEVRDIQEDLLIYSIKNGIKPRIHIHSKSNCNYMM